MKCPDVEISDRYCRQGAAAVAVVDGCYHFLLRCHLNEPISYYPHNFPMSFSQLVLDTVVVLVLVCASSPAPLAVFAVIFALFFRSPCLRLSLRTRFPFHDSQVLEPPGVDLGPSGGRF